MGVFKSLPAARSFFAIIEERRIDFNNQPGLATTILDADIIILMLGTNACALVPQDLGE